MPGPLFSSEQIADLLKAQKYIPYEDYYSDKVIRSDRDSEVKCFDVITEDDNLSFVVEQRVQRLNFKPEFHVTLHARVGSIPSQAICRYDLQGNPHTSQKCCDDEVFIQPFQPHRHIYCPRCVRELDLWYACAELLSSDECPPMKLLTAFYDDLNIKAESPSAHGDFFGFMTHGD